MPFPVPAGNKSYAGRTKGKKAHGSDLHGKSQGMLKGCVGYLLLHNKPPRTQQLVTTRLLCHSCRGSETGCDSAGSLLGHRS